LGRAADPIGRLIHALGKLPGVGEKTATRLAFHILRADSALADELAAALVDVKARVKLCSVCCALTEEDPCATCRDPNRTDDLICVVATPQDQLAIERSGAFRGKFHILHGVLQPLEGIGPDDLRIRELVERLRNRPTAEVIVATSPNAEGETTAIYVARLLKPLGARVSRIATGVPIGGELEFADRVTIARAIEGRRDL
jgi:recombination protein RecR